MKKKTSIVDKVAYIICFRESSEDRKNALQFVLNWLESVLPNLEILIIEQDERPRLSVNLSANCKKIFIQHAGLFNRSWAFNVALKHTDKEVLAFGDADAVLTKEDYLACFEACMEYDAVTPNARVATNVNNIDLKNLTFETLGERYIVFASMLLMITRSGLKRIGGWDERFEGWGYEDNALGHLALNLLKTKSFNHTIYHVDHQRTTVDGITQPRFSYNEKIFDEISLFSGQSLNRYCSLVQTWERGNSFKYVSTLKKQASEKLTFVLGVLTLNQPTLVKSFFDNWLTFRSPTVNWEIIIVDDGSDKLLLDFLENLSIKQTSISIIKNKNKGITNALNCLFKALTQRTYDLAFISQVNIQFKQSGWENLYWQLVNRTAIGMLVYQSKSETEKGRKVGFFASNQAINELRPYFFTMTPSVIKEIGYMDHQYLGFSYLGFQEYFLRCSRGGFNFSSYPLDADGSEDFIGLKMEEGLQYDTEIESFLTLLHPFLRKRYNNIFQSNRIYLAWNEVDLPLKAYKKIMQDRFPTLQTEQSLSQ